MNAFLLDVQQKTVGDHRGHRRVWLQGKTPERAGFVVGQPYRVVTLTDKVVLEICQKNELAFGAKIRIVSVKKERGNEVPVIDLNHNELLRCFEGMSAIKAVYRDGVIELLPLASEVARIEREESLLSALESGELNMASSSHGGGIMSLALHEGIKKAGLKPRLVWANEIREELLDVAAANNPAWDNRTVGIAMPIQELAHDDYLMNLLNQTPIHFLEVGIPCSAASSAGRASKKTACAEQHEHVGHLVHGLLALVAKLSPAILAIECVNNWFSSGSSWIARNQLRDMGYKVQEITIDSGDWNALEDRTRTVMVAVSRGISFDLENLVTYKPAPQAMAVADILDHIADNDEAWSDFAGNVAHVAKQAEKGNNFAMQTVVPSDQRIGCLTKGYARKRATDWKLRNENTGLMRQFTPAEHARAKQCSPALIEGCCMTVAHEILGQSVVFEPFVSVGHLIGDSLTNWLDTRWIDDQDVSAGALLAKVA